MAQQSERGVDGRFNGLGPVCPNLLAGRLRQPVQRVQLLLGDALSPALPHVQCPALAQHGRPVIVRGGIPLDSLSLTSALKRRDHDRGKKRGNHARDGIQVRSNSFNFS